MELSVGFIPYTIPVEMFDVDGNYLATFISSATAAKVTGFDQDIIISCCIGYKRESYKKYKFKFGKVDLVK